MRAYRVEQIDGPFLEVDLTMPKVAVAVLFNLTTLHT